MQRLTELLLPWYAENRRELPWRADREPYHVWLSEIMLQQTRVEAVKGYYLRFLQALPDIAALAEAPEERLLKLWEGLGYYSRVRNLHRAAQIIVADGGVFPAQYDAIRSLPGIGDYTAGAIASICFEQPTPAVDGNVLRVLSRYLASDEPITDVRVRRRCAARLAAVYPVGHCGDFTQALMELGATVCVPNGAPRCEACPLAAHCAAKRSGTQLCYPVKAAKRSRRVEERTVLILCCGDKIALCKRPPRGLLAGLWQLPDLAGASDAQQAVITAEEWGVRPLCIEKTARRTHIFTHVQWNMTGFYLRCGEETHFTWVTPSELNEQIGLPTAYRQFLEDL